MPITRYDRSALSVPKGRIFKADDDGNVNFEDNETYLGFADPFTLAIATALEPQFSAECGVDEVIDEIPGSTTRSATVAVRSISDFALAMFFVGRRTQMVKTAALAVPDTRVMRPGEYTQLGTDIDFPSGTRLIDNLTNAGGFVEGVDYQTDLTHARIYVMKASEGGTITADTPVIWTFDQLAATWQQIRSGRGRPYEGPVRYLACDYVSGEEWDYFFPLARVTPNGDFIAKQQGSTPTNVPLNLTIRQPTDGRDAIYIDGQPA